MPVPEVGSLAGPSPCWHNQLSPAQLGCWGGAGLLGSGDAEAKGTPGARSHQGLSWRKWARERAGVQEANTEKQQQQPSPSGRSEVPRQPLGWGHLLGTKPPWGLRVKVKKEPFFGLE